MPVLELLVDIVSIESVDKYHMMSDVRWGIVSFPGEIKIRLPTNTVREMLQGKDDIRRRAVVKFTFED